MSDQPQPWNERAVYRILRFANKNTGTVGLDDDDLYTDGNETTPCQWDTKVVAYARVLQFVLHDIANMPDYDQDDAHRLRYKAQMALALLEEKEGLAQ